MASLVGQALTDTPVVLVNGPRQCGKTTLARQFSGVARAWMTLDDETQLAAALADPVGFIDAHGDMAIDEVQRAPALLRAIKRSVDENRKPGRFLLTGSTDVLSLPSIADSLAGRMEIVELLPFSQAELRGQPSGLLPRLFASKLPQAEARAPLGAPTLEQRVLLGGYPEMLARALPARRQAWARDYVRAIVQRDVRDIAQIDKLDKLPLLLRATAQQSAQLANFNQLAGQLGMDAKTARKYAGILEQVFLIKRLEPWANNYLSRLVKTPKLHLLDTGLLATLRGLTHERLIRDRKAWGVLLETFVHAELLKMLPLQDQACRLFHYRDKDQLEVDVVLETDGGDVAGFEVKAAASVNAGDFTGLRKLAKLSGGAFIGGMVLYDGAHVASFGGNLHAVPFSALWTP